VLAPAKCPRHSSHEGQSQFLNTPVADQIADSSDTGLPPHFSSAAAPQHEEHDATDISVHGLDAITENQGNEIPLNFVSRTSLGSSIRREARLSEKPGF
jgi:hypothetical protein